MYVCMYVCVYVCYIHTYIHTYTHTYVTYMPTYIVFAHPKVAFLPKFAACSNAVGSCVAHVAFKRRVFMPQRRLHILSLASVVFLRIRRSPSFRRSLLVATPDDFVCAGGPGGAATNDGCVCACFNCRLFLCATTNDCRPLGGCKQCSQHVPCNCFQVSCFHVAVAYVFLMYELCVRKCKDGGDGNTA